MPHINLPEGLQGIRSAMAFRPETAKPLNELAEALLHAPNSLPQADRELIAQGGFFDDEPERRFFGRRRNRD